MSRTSTASYGKSIGVVVIGVSAVLFVAGVVIYLLSKDQRSGPPGWIWLLISALALPALALGIYLTRRGLREDRILRTGLVGQATIMGMTGTGMAVGGNYTDGTGGSATPIYRIALRVQVPGRPSYEASVREAVPPARRFYLQPGTTVAIRADPKRLDRLVIDWDSR